MKDSNFKTPRTMREGQWIEGHDPIVAYGADGIGVWGALCIFVIVMAFIGVFLWRVFA